MRVGISGTGIQFERDLSDMMKPHKLESSQHLQVKEPLEEKRDNTMQTIKIDTR